MNISLDERVNHSHEVSALEKSVRQPRRLLLPVKINEDVGLVDAIKRATSAFGIKPCGGCDGRAAGLNRLLVISGRRRKSVPSFLLILNGSQKRTQSCCAGCVTPGRVGNHQVFGVAMEPKLWGSPGFFGEVSAQCPVKPPQGAGSWATGLSVQLNDNGSQKGRLVRPAKSSSH